MGNHENMGGLERIEELDLLGNYFVSHENQNGMGNKTAFGLRATVEILGLDDDIFLKWDGRDGSSWFFTNTRWKGIKYLVDSTVELILVSFPINKFMPFPRFLFPDKDFKVPHLYLLNRQGSDNNSLSDIDGQYMGYGFNLAKDIIKNPALENLISGLNDICLANGNGDPLKLRETLIGLREIYSPYVGDRIHFRLAKDDEQEY